MAFDFFKSKLARSSESNKESLERISENRFVMDDNTFSRLRDVIYQLSGIYYTDDKKSFIESRISKRLIEKNIDTYNSYIKLLQTPSSREEINKLFEAITINETYFFRAEQQYDVLEKIIIPEILKNQINSTNPYLRIWSAGCSSGEEAYSIAILILEKLKTQFPNITFQILASDINNTSLDIARKGIYKEYSIRNVPSPYLFKYFKKEGPSFILKDEVKRLVKFTNLNLFDNEQMQTVKDCDIIFCCNVLIYFDVPSKQKVISDLYNSLNHNGFLFVGYTESLQGVAEGFKLVHLPKAMAYKKE
jgi:chemotaxis protein methyltransferase CheR